MKKMFLMVLSVLMISCGGNEDEPKKTEPENPKLNKEAVIEVKEENGFKKVDVTDLSAKEEYVKFNLEKAAVVTGDDWDIAFYSRSVIVNGGEYVIDAPYAAVQPTRTAEAAIAIMGKDEAKELKAESFAIIAKETDGDYLKTLEVPDTAIFLQDTEENGFAIDYNSKGMFEYDFPIQHIVSIKKNRFLIIKTHKGHYAKLKFKSLYAGAGETAITSLETGNMNDGLKYFGFYTFTYNYNMKKGDKKLE